MYNNSKIYLLIALTLALVLSGVGVCFADSITPYFVPAEILTTGNSAFQSASCKGYTAIDRSGYNAGIALAVGLDYSGQVLVFRYPNSNSNYPDKFCLCSGDYFDYQYLTASYGTFNNLASVSHTSTGNFWSYGDVIYSTAYYDIGTSSITYNSDIPYFSSLNDGLAWVSSIMTSVADLYSCSIPAGYALHIYSNSAFTLGDIDLSITDSYNFDRINGVSYRYNGARLHSMLTENMVDNYSANAWSMIPWEPTNANIFGKASNYAYHYESDQTVPVGESWVVINPLYYGSWAQNEYQVDTNVPIQATISYNHSDTVYFDLVPLTASVTYENGVGSYLNVFSPSKGVIHGVLEPSTDPDESGNIDFGVPPVGGGNTGQPSVNGSSSLVDIIENFLNSVTRIFNAGINAVRTVINSGTTFLSYVSTMFSWLPPDLSTVIFSILTVILVAGVIKLL